MKKLILIAATWLTFSGCAKDALAPAEANQNSESAVAQRQAAPTTSTIATIKYYGDPAVDGLGWVLVVNEDNPEFSRERVEVPSNLPKEFFKEDGLVNVVYKSTDQRVACRCAQPKYMVEIISIDWAKQ
jgi:hypothetical protein